MYDIAALNKIISPLYQDIENDNSNVNLFIYADIYDQVTGESTELAYDKPVFKESKNFETLPEADFAYNIENLFEPTVFTTLINDVEYEIYSQPVPSTA